jgi:cytoskeletal protein RodZ
MADRPPGDFGRRLREARERRGVSLRQIANATKIGIGALEALERNDVSRLPGGIFSRAFVRSYAVEVGLDPDRTLQDFIAQFPHDSVAVGDPRSIQSEDHQAIESDRRSATTLMRLILLSLPIAGAILYFTTVGRRAASSAAETTPAPTANTLVDASARAERLMVAISATGACRVSTTVDGENTVDRLLQPGEQLVLDVHRELVLTAGDAAAIAITLNGAGARPLGGPGQAVTVRLNPANFKDYLANQ